MMSVEVVGSLKTRFRADVEGLRGVAILLVVAHHVGLPYVTGGFVGVDVFFVLSGFLITGLLLDESSATGRIDLAAFYARRVRRLMPAALTVLAATIVAAALLYSPAQIASVTASAQAAAGFASNVVLAHQATDYFGPNVGALPLLHTWSLSVEEQFYLVWPCLVMVAAGRTTNRARMCVALLGVAAVSLGACWWYTFASRPTAFYGTPMRAWEFALGALAALAARELAAWELAPVDALGTLPRTLARASGWCGLILVLGAAFVFTGRTRFPGVNALVPTLGAALVVLGAAGTGRGAVGNALSARWLQWIGRHSYAWYLWHWPMLALAADLLPDASVLVRVALVVAALGISVATRIWIEEPCRRSAVLAKHSRFTVAAGLATVLLFLGGAEALRRGALAAANGPRQRAYTAAVGDRSRLYVDGCNPTLDDATVKVCEYGVRTARTTVLLAGDSHAAAWLPALDAIAHQRDWRLLVVTKSACTIADISVFEPVLGRTFAECDAWRRSALDTIRARRPDLVVLASTAEWVLGDPRPEVRTSVTPAEWERAFAKTLSQLQRAHVRAAVLQDVPVASEGVPDCLRRADWRGRPLSGCDFRLSESANREAARAIERAASRFGDDRVLDLSAAICPHDHCPAIADGVVRYRDKRHITATAALRLTPALSAAMDSAGLFTELDAARVGMPAGSRRVIASALGRE